MFRDTQQELARMEQLLAQEEENQQEEETLEQEDRPTVQCPVFNTDLTDTDLDRYSREVYDPPRKKNTDLIALLMILMTGIVLALLWLVLRLGGYV